MRRMWLGREVVVTAFLPSEESTAGKTMTRQIGQKNQGWKEGGGQHGIIQENYIKFRLLIIIIQGKKVSNLDLAQVI